MFSINPIQIAMTAVGGPLGGVLGSILGQMTGGGNPMKLMESVMKAFDGIFKSGGGAKGQMQTPFSPQPQPFSTGPGGVAITIQSPLSALPQGGAAGTGMEQISKLLSDLLAKMQGMPGAGAAGGAFAGASAGAGAASGIGGASGSASGASSAAGGSSSGFSVGNSGSWGNIDSMTSQAEALMSSDKQSDQLKGQQMMQKATRMFEMISKMIEQRSQMSMKAIQAIK